MESITLYFKGGGSDKVYQVSIQEKENGCVVQYAFGRRGSTLSTGFKTEKPVQKEVAKRIYDKLVKEKMAKGYRPGESSASYQPAAPRPEYVGFLPQLLNPIDSDEAVRFISDDAWCMQEKFDGKRMLLRKTGSVVQGINRNGLVVAVPDPIVQEIGHIQGDLIVDGECVGEKFIAFDVLEHDGIDYCPQSYIKRLAVLLKLFSEKSDHLALADTVFGASSKAEMLRQLRLGNKEGAVFKKISAPYLEGRPASGGDALKFKFYETATFLVTGVNQRRSVNLGLWSEGELVSAGNVTIPANHSVPAKNSIVEVRYLYAFRVSGSVYQPVYLGERDDILPQQCTVAQLKYKEAVIEEAA